MSPGERESSGAVIEAGGFPCRRRMAHGAVRGKIGKDVLGACNIVRVHLVTGNALQRGPVEPPSRVALDAWRGCVSARQREGGLCMIEAASPADGCYSMALCAVSVESR